MNNYSNKYPGEELEIDPTISEDDVLRELNEEIPAKYNEIRELVRRYLTWKKLFGDGEFIENMAENEAFVAGNFEDKQIWSLIRYEDCRVSLGFISDETVEGWYVSSKLADKQYADVLFELTIGCSACEESGEVDDEECAECEGQGTIFFRVDY